MLDSGYWILDLKMKLSLIKLGTLNPEPLFCSSLSGLGESIDVTGGRAE
jgi:hypothetical protein